MSTRAVDDVAADSDGDFHSFNDANFSDTSASSPTVRERQIAIDPQSLKILAKMGANFFANSSSSLQSPTAPSPPPATPPVPQPSPKNHKKWPPEIPKVAAGDGHAAALTRSKSRGEGRSSAPADDIADLLARPSVSQHLREAGDENEQDNDMIANGEEADAAGVAKRNASSGDSFKCGCFFLPGVSAKRKIIAPSYQKHYQFNSVASAKTTAAASTATDAAVVDEAVRQSIEKICRSSSAASRAVSMEKFECGAWSPSGLLDGDNDGEEGMYSYFDLPLELIRNGQSDTDSPVSTAFVFERDLKGVLKRSEERKGKKATATRELSNRHVRFSTSMPTSGSVPGSPASVCVTPRLRKAREEFNAFLEAQSA